MEQEQRRGSGGGKISGQLQAIFDKYRGQQGTLIPILQEAQNRYGYLPREVIGEIARTTDNPVSRIYGIVTFYSQFHLKPRGRNIIKVCQGTACHVRGGKKILNFIEDKLGIKPGDTTADLRYTLETVACIGACGLAPVLMVNDDTHGRLTTELLPWILDRYK
ncbi:MAG: NADH-quinone oxidoreductase subunit NuoE [Acidaminococcales bacterium]|jgi:NADH-quinone oxidoreductase E subunit|nr:NADH-quinone oxidoreductase subunit NuoE [Acidaminococcales bacterium]